MFSVRIGIWKRGQKRSSKREIPLNEGENRETRFRDRPKLIDLRLQRTPRSVRIRRSPRKNFLGKSIFASDSRFEKVIFFHGKWGDLPIKKCPKIFLSSFCPNFHLGSLLRRHFDFDLVFASGLAFLKMDKKGRSLRSRQRGDPARIQGRDGFHFWLGCRNLTGRNHSSKLELAFLTP